MDKNTDSPSEKKVLHPLSDSTPAGDEAWLAEFQLYLNLEYT
jgi:hypothetical protein